VVSQPDFHSKHIPLPGYRVLHDQQADVFVAERVKLSDFRLGITHSTVRIGAIIITNLGAHISNSTIVVITAIEAKVSISANFTIVEASSFTSLAQVLYLLGPAVRLFLLASTSSAGEEEEQD
jgi:hypothetical protein